LKIGAPGPTRAIFRKLDG